MISAILDNGTATSVDLSCVPSGRPASDASNACFLADHSDSISSFVLAFSNVLHSWAFARACAELRLSFTVLVEPENLREYQ
jgi:hypothetical protein